MWKRVYDILLSSMYHISVFLFQIKQYKLSFRHIFHPFQLKHFANVYLFGNTGSPSLPSQALFVFFIQDERIS